MLSANSASDIRNEWSGVVRMLERMKSLVVVTFATGGIVSPGLAKVVYNLPLLLAFDVLNQALVHAKAEGHFQCKRSQLGELMDAAQLSLNWLDWAELRSGVRRRNEVAHDGVLFDSQQCLKDIAAIESQLVMWGV